MAPVPEHASGMTSWEVCTRRLSPAQHLDEERLVLGRAVVKDRLGHRQQHFARHGRRSRRHQLVLLHRLTASCVGGWIGFDTSTPSRARAAAAERGDEDRVASGRVRREEPHDLGVVEREPAGAEAQGVGRQVRAAAGDAGIEVGQAIPAVAPRLPDRVERRQEEDRRRRVATQRLLERQIRRLVAERARPDAARDRGPASTRRRRAPRRPPR